MITEFKLKKYLSFNEVDIEFKKGLIVFSGASGAGKSIFMNAILDTFGIKQTEAKNIDAVLEIPKKLEEYGIEESLEYFFKKNKNEKTRYYINNQLIQKKKLKELSQSFIKYLHVKDLSDFSNDNLLKILDKIVSKNDFEHLKEIENLEKKLKEKKESQNKLKKLEEEEQNIEEIKEFLEFEITQIEKLNPSEEEYEEIQKIKKSLTHKDLIEEKLIKCQELLENENYVYKLFELIEKDNTFISEALNELREIIDEENQKLIELNQYNIEELLDKIEGYSKLIKKYGSIQEIINNLIIKKEELNNLDNIGFEKLQEEKKYKKINEELNNISNKITKSRKKSLKVFEKELNEYLKNLYIKNLEINIEEQKEITKIGKDEIVITLNQTNLKNISTGEFNRLRLAILALKTNYEDNTGILMLDEIDANLSGEESMSVAKVLKVLAKKYQIFAISHLPQLTSTANQHFLIYKENDESKIKEIKDKQRVEEIARLISGKKITDEAYIFAEKIIKENIS
jgi:DNA repair protein RecN (Recombination protein N)